MSAVVSGREVVLLLLLLLRVVATFGVMLSLVLVGRYLERGQGRAAFAWTLFSLVGAAAFCLLVELSARVELLG